MALQPTTMNCQRMPSILNKQLIFAVLSDGFYNNIIAAKCAVSIKNCHSGKTMGVDYLHDNAQHCQLAKSPGVP
jgi:hypothetical protein